MPVLKINSIDQDSKKIDLVAMIDNINGYFIVDYSGSELIKEGPNMCCEGITKINDNPNAKAVLTIYPRPDAKKHLGRLVVTDYTTTPK
jgi:hypothetical protein